MRDIIFALPVLERDEINAFRLREAFDGANEALARRRASIAVDGTRTPCRVLSK